MSTDEQPEIEAGTEEPAAESKAKLPILIGLVAVGLAVGGGTGASIVGPMVAKKMGKVAQVSTAADSAEAESGESAGSGEAGKEGSAATILLLENLVLNPAASGGSRFLLLSVAIEVSKAATLEQLKTRDAELRDIVLTSLGTKTVDELTDISQRDRFKSELQALIEARFGKQTIKRLYFPQFVVQ